MAVPKRRTSKARKRKRRTHYKHTRVVPVNCTSCGESVLPHHICPSCGNYKDKSEIRVIEEEVEE